MTKLLSLLFVSLLVSCSSIQKNNKDELAIKKKLTPDQIKELNEKTLKTVSKRLGELTKAALEAGEDKVRYLSNDMYLKASAAMMEGDYTTANIIFEHLVNLVPKDAFVKKKYAVSLIRTGQLTKSKDILAQIMMKDKKLDEDVALVLAGVHSSLGEVKKSQKIYKKIITKNAHNQDACVF